MALTLTQLVERFRYRLLKEGLDEEQAGVYSFQVASWFEQAAQRLTERLLQAEKASPLLKTVSGITVTSGVIDLTNTQYDNLLLEGGLPAFGLIDPGAGKKCVWVPRVEDLNRQHPMGTLFIRYAVVGRKIFTRNTDGSTTSLGGTVNITCPSVPSRTGDSIDIDPTLYDDLVDILLEMYHEKSVPQLAEQEAENA